MGVGGIAEQRGFLGSQSHNLIDDRVIVAGTPASAARDKCVEQSLTQIAPG